MERDPDDAALLNEMTRCLAQHPFMGPQRLPEEPSWNCSVTPCQLICQGLTAAQSQEMG
jgi:hypothetical protein